MRKANIQNLTPFKPGQSGNLKGRPKKLPALDKLLADKLGSEDDKDSPASAIVDKLIELAKKGDIRATEILMDRAWGKAKQSLHVEGQPFKTLIIDRASRRTDPVDK